LPSTATASTASSTAGQVSVYPIANSRTASPTTQISLRGIPAAQVGTVTVTGSRSGSHPGKLSVDSDGNGVSFVPATAFLPGEQVTVSTSLQLVGGTGGSYQFTVSRPVAHSESAAPESLFPHDVQAFYSAPTLEAPTLIVQSGAAAETADDIFTAPYRGSGPAGPMITDSAGKLIWFDPLPDGLEAFDFRTQTYAGQPVLTWWQGQVSSTGQGYGEDEIYSPSYQPIATVTAGNGYQSDLHEFQLTAGGTALVTAYQPVTWDTSSVGGSTNGVVLDAIVEEIDIATGNVLFEWHSLDHVALTASFADLSTQYDYFHVNSIDIDVAGNFLISSRATHTIYQVDRATGDVIWQLGGKSSDFTGTGTVFNSQHNVKWLTPTSISVFDNGAGVGTSTEPQTRGLIIDLDIPDRIATLARSYSSTSLPQASSQGNVEPLADGNVFVGWGAQPFVSEFNAGGSLIFQAQLPASTMSYRAYLSPWSGQPGAKPAVAAVAGAKSTTVYASWNGATDVASWQVLAGDDPGQLSVAAAAPRSGFETKLISPTTSAYVAVQAIDGAGKVLATSSVVRVGS
jgi:Arylsulfotransferase (ASST)